MVGRNSCGGATTGWVTDTIGAAITPSLIEAVDLPTVAALLDHSPFDTVRIYAQPDEAALERAVAALESR